jgi:hypothetical protein
VTVTFAAQCTLLARLNGLMIQQPYHYAPTRVYQAFIAFCACALVGGISVGAASGETRYVLVFVTVTVAAWSVHRAFRLELSASRDGVKIRNFWRSFEPGWSEITDVGVGLKTMGVVPQSAFAFGASDREFRAQATPSKRSDREAAFNALRALAPPAVTFHPPTG